MIERFHLPTAHVDQLLAESHATEPPGERSARRRRRALAFFALGLMLYGADVHANRQAEARAEVTIDIIDAHALDPAFNDQAILAIGGYKSVDGGLVMEGIGKALRLVYDGQLWVLKTGNADFNDDAVADAVDEIAEKTGVDRIAIVGHSGGGILGNGTMASMIEDQGGPTVELEILASTPSGVESLQPAQQQGLEFANFLSNFGEVSYSSPAQYVTGMAFELERIDDFESLIDAHNDTLEGIENNTTASVATQVRQALSIVDADFKQEYESIADIDWVQQNPVVVYLAANGDTKVQNAEASADIGEHASSNGIPFIQGEVPGYVSHERPDLFADNYAAAFEEYGDEITAAIQNERKAVRTIGRNPASEVHPI